LRYGGFLADCNLKQSEGEPEILDPHGPDTSRKADRDFRRAPRKHHSDEDKIRIVLEGLVFEEGIEIYKNRGQRVSPFWSPLLLQSPPSRTGLVPQVTT
jgi:hypothetical protein